MLTRRGSATPAVRKALAGRMSEADLYNHRLHLLLKVFNLGNLHGEGSGEDDVLVLHLVVGLEQAGGKH